MSIVYLAAPYTDPDYAVRGDRVELASIAAAELMKEGVCVYSPLSHGHTVSQHLATPGSHEFWMRQCLPILSKCAKLYVLPLAGWQKSRGVQEEILHANSLGIPISLIQSLPHGFARYLEQVEGRGLLEVGWGAIRVGEERELV